MNAFNTALTTIKRSPYQSLSLLIVVSITMFVAYCISFILLTAQIVLLDLETKPQVIAFFNLGTTPEVLSQVENDVKSQSGVKNVTVISQEQALELYQQENKDDPLLLELVTANILPASIEVQGQTLTDLQNIKTTLDQIDAIDEVIFPEDFINGIKQWMNSLRLGAVGAVAVMGIQFFLTIFIAIGLKTASQKQAISIARLLGASRSFIKQPLAIEGSLYGIISSLIGWTLAVSFLLYISPRLNELGVPTTTVAQPHILALQLGIGTIVTLLLGAIAGYFAGSRLLHSN